MSVRRSIRGKAVVFLAAIAGFTPLWVSAADQAESKLLAEASVTRVLATSQDLAEAIPRLLAALG